MAGPVVEKEMSISHADFLRLLPRALGTEDFSLEGNRIRLDRPGRRLEITLGPEGERRIARLTLPVTRVRLVFSGYGAEEARAALCRFDRAYQRGGG